MNRLLDAALAYASRGWPVFPVAPRGKIPLTKNGFLDASTNESTIRGWWRRWPAANVGVPCGPETFDVLDVDGEEGHRMLAALEEANGPLPDGPRQQTGGGGLHVLLRGGSLGTSARRLPGLDTRGAKADGKPGGYIVVAPSVHSSGAAYAWLDESDALPIPECPAWLVHELGAGTAPAPPVPTGPPAEVPDDTARDLLLMAGVKLNVIAEGGRNATLFKLGCRLRGKGLDFPGIFRIVRLANKHLCRPPLPDQEVEKTARSAAKHAVSPEYQALAQQERAAEEAAAEVVERAAETIDRAEKRQQAAEQRVEKKVEAIRAKQDATAEAAYVDHQASSDDVEALRDLIASQAGVRIRRVLQVGLDTPHYYLELADGDPPVYVGQTLTLQRPVGEALVKFRRLPGIALLKSQRWPPVCRALLKLVTVETPTEMQRREETRLWVRAMVEAETAMSDSALRRSYDAVRQRRPFVDEGLLYVSAPGALRHLRVTMAAPGSMTLAELVARLKELGFEKGPNAQGVVTERTPDGSRSASASYWRAPISSVEAPQAVAEEP